MTVREIYEFAVGRGMDLDPRGRKVLEDQLALRRREFESLQGEQRDLFDQERLRNPFGDTRIAAGDPDTKVRRLVVGIDITGAEILLAHALTQSGKRVDAVWSHHASAMGTALADVEDTMWLQVHMMIEVGVPPHVAEKLVRADAAGRRRGDDFRWVQVAEALGLPVLNLHAPPDLYNLRYLRDLIERGRPQTVGDLVAIIQGIPECRWLYDQGTPVTVPVGEERGPLGPLYLVMAGGWNPTVPCMEAICRAGVGTFVLVATSPELNEVAARHHASIVIYPHWPADSAGMNLLLDDLCRVSPIDVVPTGNYIRVDRTLSPDPSRAARTAKGKGNHVARPRRST